MNTQELEFLKNASSSLIKRDSFNSTRGLRLIGSPLQKARVKINYWYSPSKIPQPKFIIDGVGFDADELYDEKLFDNLANKVKEAVKRTKNQHRLMTRRLKHF